ncbi:hypothetical protein BV20DRAFT_1110233 [Pilatotrama ljubarskyi]|nr:hypothetical protein BV20DRAFT_1110233 [Pilatotrama ljubarskyi]
MVAVAPISPRSSGADSLGCPYSHKAIRCELIFKDEFTTLSSEEADKMIDKMEGTTTLMLPGLISSEFSTLPRLSNRLLPVVDGDFAPEYYIFVLRDDATWQGMTAPLDPEVIGAVRRLVVQSEEPD